MATKKTSDYLGLPAGTIDDTWLYDIAVPAVTNYKATGLEVRVEVQKGIPGGKTIEGGTLTTETLQLHNNTADGLGLTINASGDTDFGIQKTIFGAGTDTTHTALEYNNASTTKPILKWSSSIGGIASYNGLHLEVQESGKAVSSHVESHTAAAFKILSTRNASFSVQEFIGYLSTGQLESGTRKAWAKQFDAPSGDLKFQTINNAVITNRFVMSFSTGIPTFPALNTVNGIVQTDGSGVFSSSITLPDGTLATTQSPLDNSTKLATTEYVDAAVVVENIWDRDISGTPFIKPHTTGDHLHLNDEESTLFTTNEFQIFKNSAADVSAWSASAVANEDANLNLIRSRGTIASPLAVADGDLIGNINMEAASDSSNFNNGVEIRGEISGPVSTAVLPCDLVFMVNAGAAVTTEGMRLDKNKKLTVVGEGQFSGLLTVDNVIITGNTISTSSGDLNLNSFTDDIFMENVKPSTLQFGGSQQVNEVSITIGSLSTDSQLTTAKEIFDSFAYLAGKIGGQVLSGGSAGTNNLDLQSTSHATKGTVRIRDGSNFLFDDGGLFEVSPNKDAKITLGRAMLSSPTTDVMYLSHYDNGDSNTDYAIKQLASGRTCVNGKTGTDVNFCIDNVTKASVSATGLLVDNININGNTLSSTSGNLNLTPVAGSDAIIDGHWGFDGTVLTALTDANTTITAYAGKNITIEGVSFDGVTLTMSNDSTDYVINCVRGAGAGKDFIVNAADAGFAGGSPENGGNIILNTGAEISGGTDGEIYLKINDVTKCQLDAAGVLHTDAIATLTDTNMSITALVGRDITLTTSGTGLTKLAGDATVEGTIILEGGQAVNITTVNAATYDLLTTDYILSVTYTVTGAVTSLTIPDAQFVPGRVIHIKDAGLNAGTNNITIDTVGAAKKIEGNDTLVISGDGESISLYCGDSNNMYIF